MKLGMIGLGRMGANLVRRLTKDGHRCVVFAFFHAGMWVVESSNPLQQSDFLQSLLQVFFHREALGEYDIAPRV